MVKFTKIKTGQLADFLKTVHQRVAVNEELARGLRNVQVVFKEA